MSWNGVFMAEVKKHECLYNKFCREYRNKDLRNQCWQKVAAKFDMSPMDAEKKFRNIRTSYGRFLKKRRMSTPAKSEGQEFIPFAFENCEWLSLHIIHRNFDGNSSEDAKHVDSASDDETSPVTMSNIEFMNFGSEYNDHGSSDNSQTIEAIKTAPVEVQTAPPNINITSNKLQEDNNKQTTSYNHININKSSNPHSMSSRNTKSYSNINDSHLMTTSSHINQPAEIDLSSNKSLVSNDNSKSAQYYKRKYSELEDEDELYCRSLVPRLKRLTPQAKAYVRIQMEQLLFHAEYSEQTPQIGAPFGSRFNDKTQPTSFLNGRDTRSVYALKDSE